MLQRLPGLDGLRAFAVTAVIGYHCAIQRFFEGGFLGVDIFFAISGFLITALLLAEVQAHGRIAIGRFYVRRTRRLLPAALALMIVTIVLTPLLAPQAFERLRTDAPYALIYASNWWQIHSKQSYFEALGYPPLLQHLWSLAVEEQYYIIWPLLFGLLLKVVGRAGAGWVSIGLALASSLWMGLVYQTTLGEGDPSRAYLGTDTHVMGLFAGSALACFWQPWRGGPRLADADMPVGQPLRGATGAAVLFWVCASGLAAMIGLFNHAHPALFQGGFLMAAVLTCGVIVGVTAPGAQPMQWLGSRPVQWVGTRSYSLYLVHWPVFVWLQPAREAALDTWVLTSVALLITGVWAELSYRLVEQRFRGERALVPRISWSGVSAALLAGLAATALIAPTLSGMPTDLHRATPVDETGAPQRWPQETVASGVGGSKLGVEPFASIAPDAAQIAPKGRDIVAIGDSVLLGAREFLARSLPGIYVDARTSRQAQEGARLIRDMSNEGPLTGKVVLHLGTNGYIVESDLRRLLGDLAHCESVVIVNVHANRRWTPINNALIEKVLPAFRNVQLLNWSEMARDRPEYFVSDGIHLTGSGIQAYVNAIRLALGVAPAEVVPEIVARSGRASTVVPQSISPTRPGVVVPATTAPPSDAVQATGSTPAAPAHSGAFDPDPQQADDAHCSACVHKTTVAPHDRQALAAVAVRH